MIEVSLNEDDEKELATLFEELAKRRKVAESLEVGTRDRALAFRSATAVMRQIEAIVPPATEPLR